MGNSDPVPRHLLPHRHGTKWSRRQRLSRPRPTYGYRVGHDVGVAALFHLEVTQRVVLDLEFFPPADRLGCVIHARWTGEHIVAGQVLLDSDPVLGFHLLPEHALHRLAAGNVGPGAWLALPPHRAARPFDGQCKHQRTPDPRLQHGAILQQTIPFTGTSYSEGTSLMLRP